MATLQFDATKVEPAGISSQLPVSGPDGYGVIISASEMKENKDKTGGYLELTLQVIDGEHKGETGAYRLNLFHSNAKTVEIAYRQLSAVCHAVGVFQVADSSQLHNILFKAVVGLQKGDNPEGYTEVKGVLCSDGSTPGKPKGPAQAAQPAPVQQASVQQPVQQSAAPAAGGWPGAAPAQQQAPVQQEQQPAQGWAQQPVQQAAAPWGGQK